ncbi:2Fe-2S iron-sulfur cluster-binding protein [Marinomonas mediterranea]|jgi:aminomethyltransferase (EC 2.1.2.10)|uniref:Glycine cleavage T protein (Aminomethyl transferase) n=1 Tax=Marinomonas mediterranea (strain ATCC 700492 / JCM 21426 / NBRC 103028 / MMB-1) TaxID=717774 RepID=F2JV04_MARM1|nr:2Fe-2S iron-sulfur cluster-binding protein [Marinomonas mediterranea]ADZ91658.1 glycine cleavage T protein (aminomethyl transferase) [Marinomonas mediterranea MMB-1]WCN17758.1 FAD-dependent oxidoreductase [Marinomonas mediterranea MMB-1]
MATHDRLSEPTGLFINREKSVQFEFEGVSYQGVEGDTIASALIANGQWLMSRSFKYHRPRGPLTMAGQDANTLVQLPSEPNVLADRMTLSSDLKAQGQNYNGSLESDKDAKLGLAGRFMPVGFYYRSFYKPKGAWDKWEPFIRKKAGLGYADLSFDPIHKDTDQYYDKAYLFHDIAVIGAGPAGMAAALKAADAGASVLLVDEQPELGGALTYHRFDIDGKESRSLRDSLVARVEQHDNIQILRNATCNGWFTDNYLPVIQGTRMYKVRAKQCIVASGAFEQHVVFRNNDVPGVVMSSAAMRLINQYAVKPAEKAIILTGNDDGYLCALELKQYGVEVPLIVDMRADGAESSLAQAVEANGINIMLGATVFEAMPSTDKKRLSAVRVHNIVRKGVVADSGITIPCDMLCMSAGYMPVYQLLCQAGAALSYNDTSAQFSISNLVSGLHIAGSVNGVHQLDRVIEDGERVATNALIALGHNLPEPQSVLCEKKINFDWPIFKHPKGKDFVDFDEDLQAKDIINATKLGYRDVQLVKRFSTVGMGPSQGRHSALPTARLVADATDRTVTETGVTTARPPFVPEKLAHIAGRIFSPQKRTPMHQRHLDLGAHMIPAGIWRRPAFYGDPANRDEIIQTESQHVRQCVGIIDVSTLGGLEIRGADAAEFINRMYTFAFLKQPVGKTRYAVLTNEQGVVIDDGVSCRIADDHFYVTATTSGVDAVFREMTKWNAQWRLDVDIANVTSAYSAVNVAGPLARKVMEKVCNDVDFSNDAFPYLAYREGSIEGVPVRLMRVGFVGELGYEIHMPTLFGEFMWDLLLLAGEEFDIRPFGVETQRLLRLEKGHIIVSQDTDGMSHPGELSLDWAISRKKPFFVGCKSVDIVMARTQTRKLVGFTLPATASKPKEGHIVLENASDANCAITGNVTSSEYSSTIGANIGMAFVGVDQQEVGTKFSIRVDHGEIVMAEVVALPFYDANNERQEV